MFQRVCGAVHTVPHQVHRAQVQAVAAMLLPCAQNQRMRIPRMVTIFRGRAPAGAGGPPLAQNAPFCQQLVHRGAHSHHTEACGLRKLLLGGTAHTFQGAQHAHGRARARLLNCLHGGSPFLPLIKVVLIIRYQYICLSTPCQGW